ncbi:MAG: 3-isopropylmalate dehydratase small subunit [Acidobacteriota bacterium]
MVEGKAHVYRRDHINTDEIIPARYLNTSDQEALAKHALEDIDPEFVTHVQVGDLVIAGENFGCGSSREHAVWALRGAGVAAVIARSFSRIFYRNAVNNGFLIIECDKALSINSGDDIQIDTVAGIIRNLTENTEYNFVPLSDFARELLAAGGLLPYVKAQIDSNAEKQSMSQWQDSGVSRR